MSGVVILGPVRRSVQPWPIAASPPRRATAGSHTISLDRRPLPLVGARTATPVLRGSTCKPSQPSFVLDCHIYNVMLRAYHDRAYERFIISSMTPPCSDAASRALEEAKHQASSGLSPPTPLAMTARSD
jgi:hypothetical protein